MAISWPAVVPMVTDTECAGGRPFCEPGLRPLLGAILLPSLVEPRGAPDLRRVQGVSLGLLTVRRRLPDKRLEDLHLILQAAFNVFQPGRRAEFPMLKNSERTQSTSMSAWQRRSRAAISSGAVSCILVTAFSIPINCLWAQFTKQRFSAWPTDRDFAPR